MRTLITGIKGFTGKYCAQALTDCAHEIFYLQSNLLDFNQVAQEIKNIAPDYAIHLAAVSTIQHDDASVFYKVNMIGTYHLLAALEKYAPAIKSIILPSTAHVYGHAIGQKGLITEKTLPGPFTHYSTSKLSMEYMAKIWMDKLPLIIVRPFNYTGRGQSVNFIIPKIVQHFSERKSVIELGNFDVIREFNDVRFVADVYTKLLEMNPVGSVLNICSGRGYTLKQVIQMCEELTGHSIKIKVNPDFIRSNEPRQLVGDPHCLKEVLSQYVEYSLEETLKWMLVPP